MSEEKAALLRAVKNSKARLQRAIDSSGWGIDARKAREDYESALDALNLYEYNNNGKLKESPK